MESFDQWKESIYAKMVKKVGSRIYWENWAKDVAEIATSHMKKMQMLIKSNNPEIQKEIDEFVAGLKKNLNNSITRQDAVEMLAQHMITKPVFDALFENYEFVKNNPVSQTMQKMIDILDKEMSDDEKDKLKRFHESVKERAQGIDNAQGKQRIILELYEKFFKIALPSEVEKLGIVYTPQECVDFIINSVEYLMNKEFGKSLSDHGVHIIDGFTGTGTFIVRLLQSGIIKPEDLLYKYTNDIHANEIVLLAYYIAAINIEETFHELSGSKEYTPFEGIVLTDTFQLYENSSQYESNIQIKEMLGENSKRAAKQKELPITVCIGNPPYSIGQKSANDDAANMHYKNLDNEISNTYAYHSKANLKRSLYDNYIRAFKWATDRVKENGIVAFITNGSFIDNQGMDGFRKCLLNDYTSVYVFNLRGNQRTSGEISKMEGGKIFGSGSRTPVSITCLVKKQHRDNDRFIYYYDIGTYLSREQKLNIIKSKKSIENIEWKKIFPDNNNDWVNKRNEKYTSFIPLFTGKHFEKESKSYFTNSVVGIVSSRDVWSYNYNRNKIEENILKMIDFYNENLANNVPINRISDNSKISWSAELKKKYVNRTRISFDRAVFDIALYRPFCKQYVYRGTDLIERPGKTERIIKTGASMICIPGSGSNKPFSCIITNCFVDFNLLSAGAHCYGLKWENKSNELGIFDNTKFIYENGISNYIVKKLREKFDKKIREEDIYYYIYGVLHSTEYRNNFAADLKKSSPNIPIVSNYFDFLKFCEAGKKLAKLHLNYEQVPLYKKCEIIINKDNYKVTKMKFGKDKDKSTIIYNDSIIIKNVPEKAYEYIVNGKSAIEWIMERYAVTTDKKSGIINDPNDWCIEVNDEKYIFNLLLRIINVSIKTVDIINSLPNLNFEN